MEEFLKKRIFEKFEKKNREESLIAINISQKPRENFLKGRYLGKKFEKRQGRMSGDPATRDSSQKWLKFEVYSPLIWVAK